MDVRRNTVKHCAKSVHTPMAERGCLALDLSGLCYVMWASVVWILLSYLKENFSILFVKGSFCKELRNVQGKYNFDCPFDGTMHGYRDHVRASTCCQRGNMCMPVDLHAHKVVGDLIYNIVPISVDWGSNVVENQDNQLKDNIKTHAIILFIFKREYAVWLQFPYTL